MTMHRFSTKDRDQAMTHTVSYLSVPVPRGTAFALYHINKHGGHIDLFSGIRVDSVIEEHNRAFRTHLHGQQYLFDHQHEKGFDPANSVRRTSHCWFSDGNPAYKDQRGRQLPPGEPLPWYMIGLDLADLGAYENVSHFLVVARSLGYEVVQPYPVGGERHHVVFTESPIAVLERYNAIAKDRA